MGKSNYPFPLTSKPKLSIMPVQRQLKVLIHLSKEENDLFLRKIANAARIAGLCFRPGSESSEYAFEIVFDVEELNFIKEALVNYVSAEIIADYFTQGSVLTALRHHRQLSPQDNEAIEDLDLALPIKSLRRRREPDRQSTKRRIGRELEPEPPLPAQ